MMTQVPLRWKRKECARCYRWWGVVGLKGRCANHRIWQLGQTAANLGAALAFSYSFGNSGRWSFFFEAPPATRYHEQPVATHPLPARLLYKLEFGGSNLILGFSQLAITMSISPIITFKAGLCQLDVSTSFSDNPHP